MTIPRIWAGALACVLAGAASATTYYVDATLGSDSADGQTVATAWKTISKVNGAALLAGDQILFKRGEVWRESLVPPASGGSGNTIKFDAYGTGEAPTITGYQDIPSTNWTLDSGNIWKATVTATLMNYVLFKGSVWGLKHTTAKTDCVALYDFYFASNTLYVYATSNPATFYGSVAAMLMANGQLVYVNGRSWLDFQHFKLTYFDYYGLRIAGASDHINVANFYVDGIIPNGTLPHGFYVSASPSPTDINFYNVESHRSYNGFRFDGTATAIKVKNCRAYANRNKGIEDNTSSNAATYSYCHLFANGVAPMLSTDVTGGVDGGNNLVGYVWPAVTGFQRYPARISTTIDDVGLVTGEDTYIDSVLPIYDARGLKVSVGVVAGYASSILPKIQSWYNAGHDIDSHSWSHQYYTHLNAFTIQYTGTGTAATVTSSGNHLTTTVTGGPGGENLDYDLTNSSYDSISKLVATISNRGVYTTIEDVNCQSATHSVALADVAAQAIKTSSYTVLLQKDRLVPDEMATSKSWLQANVLGLSNAKVYVYPSGYEDSSTQGWAVAAGYEGARGGMAMNVGLKEVYSFGVNIQDITSFAITGFHNMTQSQINGQVQALVFKSSVWGIPYGLFYHNLDLTTTEISYVLDALTQSGATVMTNTALMDWINSQSKVETTTTYVSPAPGSDVSFRPTASSPVVNAGADLGATYKYDVTGVDQNWMGSGWEMGAYAFVPSSGPYVVVVR